MKHYISGVLLTVVLALPCMADEVANVRIATAMTDAINARDLAAITWPSEPDISGSRMGQWARSRPAVRSWSYRTLGYFDSKTEKSSKSGWSGTICRH